MQFIIALQLVFFSATRTFDMRDLKNAAECPRAKFATELSSIHRREFTFHRGLGEKAYERNRSLGRTSLPQVKELGPW